MKPRLRGGKLCTGLLLASSVCFLLITQDHLPTVVWALPPQSSIKKLPYRLAYRPVS